MREKILRLIEITASTGADADKIVEQMHAQLRNGWQMFFQEGAPDDVEQALALLKERMLADREALRESIIQIYSANLTEEDLDAAIAHAEQGHAFASSPAGQRLCHAVPIIGGAVEDEKSAWCNRNLKAAEPDLHRLLGTGEPPAAPTLEDLQSSEQPTPETPSAA